MKMQSITFYWNITSFFKKLLWKPDNRLAQVSVESGTCQFRPADATSGWQVPPKTGCVAFFFQLKFFVVSLIFYNFLSVIICHNLTYYGKWITFQYIQREGFYHSLYFMCWVWGSLKSKLSFLLKISVGSTPILVWNLPEHKHELDTGQGKVTNESLQIKQNL